MISIIVEKGISPLTLLTFGKGTECPEPLHNYTIRVIEKNVTSFLLIVEVPLCEVCKDELSMTWNKVLWTQVWLFRCAIQMRIEIIEPIRIVAHFHITMAEHNN